MHRKKLSFVAMVCMGLAAPASSLNGPIFQWEDLASFDAATGDLTELGFAEVEVGTALSGEFDPLGVNFTQGNDFVAISFGAVDFTSVVENVTFPFDGIEMVFNPPAVAVAVRHMDGVDIQLFVGDVFLGSSNDFFAGPGFVGLTSDVPFDRVLLVHPDEPPAFMEMDTLYFELLPITPTCADIRKFRVQCTNGSRIKAVVRMIDNSFIGQQVTVSVDGSPTVLTIRNVVAKLKTPKLPGVHTVTLDDPPGCVGPIVVTCP